MWLHLSPGTQPRRCALCRLAVPDLDRCKSLDDRCDVDESGAEECRHEVAVLLPKGTELRDAEIFLVKAPPDEQRLAYLCSCVGVLNLDQTVAPALG